MVDKLSKVFAALADPVRRDLVARLAAGDSTVSRLAAPHDITVQAISKHLKVLEEAGLVTRGEPAARRPVHLEAQVFDLATAWIERYRREAESRYRRLDDVLADLADLDDLDAETAVSGPTPPEARPEAAPGRPPADSPATPRRSVTPRHEEGTAS